MAEKMMPLRNRFPARESLFIPAVAMPFRGRAPIQKCQRRFGSRRVSDASWFAQTIWNNRRGKSANRPGGFPVRRQPALLVRQLSGTQRSVLEVKRKTARRSEEHT